jgi:hypothetical protein
MQLDLVDHRRDGGRLGQPHQLRGLKLDTPMAGTRPEQYSCSKARQVSMT